MAVSPAPGLDISDVQEALQNLRTRRETFTRALDTIKADANADSTRRRGRPLPEPSEGGDQIPAAGISIDEIVNRREDEHRLRVIPPADVAWQNLANHLSVVRARGLNKLDTRERQLNGIIAARREPRTPAGPRQPAEPPGKDPQKVYPWVDFIADIIAYAAIFYGIVSLSFAAGIFTALMVVILLALLPVLQGIIISPIRLAIRAVFGAILQILIDLIEFVGEWFNAILQYFQGDFVKAILRMVLLAAFMWIWQEASKIPAIKGTLDYIGKAIANVVKFVNDVFDTVIKGIEWVRKQTSDAIGSMFKSLGPFGKQLSSAILGQVDRLFTGLERRVQTLRFEMVGRVDLITRALTAQVTVFGVKIGLLPDEIRVYLRSFYQARPREAVQNTADIMARAGAGLGTTVTGLTPPWFIADDQIRQMRTLLVGGTNDIEVRAVAMLAMIGALNRGETPETPALPPEWLHIPGPGEIPTTPAPAPGRPSWVPALDWQTVQGICGADHVAYLAAAIGQHETGWGLLGAGRDGFILGVGVFGGVQQEQFRGLVNQLDWACPRLRRAFPTPETVTRDNAIAFGRDVYQVPAPVPWGNDVFTLYASVYLGRIPTLA